MQISLRFSPTLNTDKERGIERYLITEHCHLIIERADGSKMPLGDIFSVAGAILDFLSVCCNEISTVTDLSVRQEKDDKLPAKVYFRMMGGDIEPKKKLSFPALYLQDLGGMRGVAQWLKIKEKYGAPIRMLASNWYNEKAYFEDRFSRMYTAIESLIARKANRRKSNMTVDSLAQFVDEYIPDFLTITSRQPKEWATEVKDIRDKQVGHSDPASVLIADGRMIHVMTNLLYVAGASFLLRKMGMGRGQIDKYIAGCRRHMLLR